MSKKKQLTAKTTPVTTPAEMPQPGIQLFQPVRFKLLACLVFVFAFAIYFNSIFNEYALDDGIVITENAFTLKGFSGIKDIFSHESFSSVAGVQTELSGGRYRPLSVASFAIEYGFFGLKPAISHFINVLLYGMLCVLLFYFLKEYIFKKNLPLAFIASIIFAAHPLHTDVVANIKGRDELLSLILLLPCLIFYLEYVSKKKIKFLFVSLAAYFLSLLAKENGITFIAVVPLLLYFFMHKKIKDSLTAAFPFIMTFAAYFLLRLSITGLPESSSREVMNAPFILATGDQALATKIMILGKYLWMLVFPHPLSYDYSYNQIPYVHFSDWKCLFSVLVNGLLIFIAAKFFKTRHVISFAILFYFITLSIVSNFVFDVGSPFNERFLFQPSIGFAMALAFLINYAGTKKPENNFYKITALLFFACISIAGAVKTILRNMDWKNNETLFAVDALHAPNSAKTNNFAGIARLQKTATEKDSVKRTRLFESAIPFFKKALEIYPGFADPYINLGNIYAQQGKLDLSKENLLKAKAIYPDNSVLATNTKYLAQRYQQLSLQLYQQHDMAGAIKAGNASLECYPENSELLYNLGGYYFTIQDIPKAKELWSRALVLDPGNATIKLWLQRISAMPLPKN